MNPETENDAGETLDVFHRGAFHLVQPALKGHRSGVDAMILASAVPNGFAGRVADLGSGAGAAGLAVALAARAPLSPLSSAPLSWPVLPARASTIR